MFSVLIVGAVVWLVLSRKGYSFERMIPYLLGAAILAYVFPIGKWVVLPFAALGSLFGGIGGGIGALGGGLGAMIGGIFGVLGGIFAFIGSVIGLVFGVIGGLLGLVFGALGLLSVLLVFGVPLLIIAFIIKAVRT